MLTYITRAEHEAVADYSAPVKIRNHYYRVIVPPVFKDLRDTATIEAEPMPDQPFKSAE